MKAKTKRMHYVVFYSPGTMFAEVSECAIKEWDTREVIRLSHGIRERHGATPYAFEFVTQIEAEPIEDCEGGKLEVEPREVKRSCRHHICGTVETWDEVEARNDPKENILRSNMRGNGYPMVVTTTNSYKATQPYQPEDVIVDADGTIVDRGNSPERTAYRKKILKLWKDNPW